VTTGAQLLVLWQASHNGGDLIAMWLGFRCAMVWAWQPASAHPALPVSL
jgi:hypothetical protein